MAVGLKIPGRYETMNSAALREVKQVVQIAVEPKNCKAVEKAVKDDLEKMIFRHSDDLDGVPLEVSEIEIQKNEEAMVHYYFPYLQVNAMAKFLVFSPSDGMKLVGDVVRLTQDMICLSVLKQFPAILHRKDIHKSLRVDPKTGAWVSKKDETYSIAVNASLVFTVKSTTSKGGLFAIEGSLKSLRKEGLVDRMKTKVKEKKEKSGKKESSSNSKKDGEREKEKEQKKKKKRISENGASPPPKKKKKK